MPFDSFNSFDSFASIFALAENARMLAEMKRAQREIQQQNERHERVMLFTEWCACKHINLNGSTDDFNASLAKLCPNLISS